MRFHTEPGTEWKNIFQLWRENGETLPFKVAKSTWSAEVGHYLVVERIEIKSSPYGAAWGATIGEACLDCRKRSRQPGPTAGSGSPASSVHMVLRSVPASLFLLKKS